LDVPRSNLAYESEIQFMSDQPKPPTPATPAESASLKSLASQRDGALRPDDTVVTADCCMHEHDTGTWPVVDDRKLVGVVEEKDLVRQIGGKGHDPKTWRVGEIMSRELVFCFEDEDCAKARRLMEERDLHYLPVVDREMRIVGIFSRKEIEEKSAIAKDEGCG
jgi:CBS domain-containing protein